MARKRFLKAVSLAVLSVAGFGLGCRGESQAAAPVAVIPDFRLPALDGREVGPSDYSGRVLLLEFWATWCGPCRVQAEILERLYADVASEDLEFLAISVGEPRETVERFVEKRPFGYPVLVDSRDELSGELMIYVLPTVVIVDRQGQMVYFEMGISSEGTLRKVLEEALRSEPAEAA